jgi:murein DD-endopeptidase MepM/ murein hydrolase activator NlpD
MVADGHMNEDQKEVYEFYNQTHGLTQQFYTPLDMDWYSQVSSYYGYRNTATGQAQLHRGVDIAVPAGTTVYAAMDGTVTTAAYDSHYGNYVVIEDSNGYCTKYAHLGILSVSAGQAITHGTAIGNMGSSAGTQLHIECLYNGEYYNPLFYFETGTADERKESEEV